MPEKYSKFGGNRSRRINDLSLLPGYEMTAFPSPQAVQINTRPATAR